jgi:DnaJ family protein C protein 2
VLGLRKLRIKATEDDIKRACKCQITLLLFILFKQNTSIIHNEIIITDRMKVLKHHPDKRRAAGEKIIEADDYFTCITMAWEMLKTPNMRRAFDSVDPEFDDDIPTANEAGKEGFYKVNI